MFHARLKLPASFQELHIALLGESFDAAAEVAVRDENHRNSPWTVEWLFEARPDVHDLNARLAITAEIHGIDLPPALSFDIEDVPDRDWLAYSYRQFPAFEVGGFFIYGAHYDGDVPDGLIGLQVNAATAFGSGEHDTTKGCLLAMEALNAQGVCPWNILDMGTGSGILGVAAWKIWRAPVMAVDNDTEAVRVADITREINAVPSGGTSMTCRVGDGFAAPDAQGKKPYELLIANILAGSLKDMAADAANVMDENGYAVLSGILNEQAESVIAAYTAQGFTLRDHMTIGDWSTLTLHYMGNISQSS